MPVDRSARKTKRAGNLDPDAKRDFKGLTLHLNEYEYTRLIKAAKAAERKPVDFMRLAVKKAVLAEIGE